jgi:hypothetical protein
MTIKQGTFPTRISKKDYDFHKSFGSITANPVFPTEYFTDAGLTMPNQDAEGLMFGCTDETQADNSTDIDGIKKNPFDLEAVTHANALGGYDIRKSLLAAVKLGWFTGFFNIQPHQLDYFDSIRLAMISGIPEKRSVSTGTPWYPKFETTDTTAILLMPDDINDPNRTWHNWSIKGWKMIGDQPYLIGKSWQGSNYGDKGFCYFSRPLINSLMNVPGAVAYTATKGILPPISTISPALWTWLISNIKSLLGLTY